MTARRARGFAILLSLLLVLILTIFGYWMLLLAETHYAATKALYDSENARTILDAALTRLLVLHNSGEPRYFTDPSTWKALQLKPFEFQNYRVTGHLSVPWDPSGLNLLNLQVHKARSFAGREVPLRQLRFEDFALFSSAPQTSTASALFDGGLFVRGGLALEQKTRFREAVHNTVAPEYLASYRKKNRLWLDFGSTTDLVFPTSFPAGLSITEKDPQFWQGDHYELRLDHLQLSHKSNTWEVKYHGNKLGETANLLLAFDGKVKITQTFREIQHLFSGNPKTSLYIVSPEEVVISGSLQSVQGASHEHPLCIFSGKQIHIESDRTAVRIQACLISSGSPLALRIDPGMDPLPDAEKQSWISEMQGSALIVESEKKTEFQEALSSNRKLVWVRGSIAVKGTITTSSDLHSIYFEACRKNHDLIPSFPFVEVLEGRQKWL